MNIDLPDWAFKAAFVALYSLCMIVIGYAIRWAQEPGSSQVDWLNYSRDRPYYLPSGRPFNDNGSAPDARPPAPPRPPNGPLT